MLANQTQSHPTLLLKGLIPWVTLIVSAIISFNLCAHEVPFTAYHADSAFSGTSASPILNTNNKRHFKTVLRDSALETANFNGHYRLTRWGCGSNCIEWAIINKHTGQVWMAPKAVSSCLSTESNQNQTVPDWFEMRLDSRLLLSYECDNERFNSIFNMRKTYVWENDMLKLLKTEKVKYKTNRWLIID
jgi:hypothetical protein